MVEALWLLLQTSTAVAQIKTLQVGDRDTIRADVKHVVHGQEFRFVLCRCDAVEVMSHRVPDSREIRPFLMRARDTWDGIPSLAPQDFSDLVSPSDLNIHHSLLV
jgi:hypothetical protein